MNEQIIVKPSIYAPEIESKYDFNNGFLNCCRTLHKRAREDYDAVVAITGDEGVSKSTCANHIGFKVDKNYSFERSVLFAPTAEGLVESIKKLPRFAAVNADEAIKVLYKQTWWLQTFINKFYRLCRQDNKISILCMPRFSEFNEGFRNHRILFWIHLLDRGIGIVYQKNWSPFSKDPWNFDKNDKMIEEIIMGRRKYHTFSLDQKISILERSPNFLDVVTFPDLPPELRIQYKELAASHKYEGMEEETTYDRRLAKAKEFYNKRLKAVVQFAVKRGIEQSEIVKATGIPQSTVSTIVSEIKS